MTASSATSAWPRKRAKSFASDIRTFVWWAAGANARLLRDESCWLERSRYTAAGAAVLITATIAAVSAMGAFSSFFPSVGMAAGFLVGIAWGGIILTLDRLLLLALYKREDGRLSMPLWAILPRFALSIVIAFAVAVPAELALFSRQLDVQVAVDQEQAIAGQQQRLNHRYDQVPALEAERDRLLAQISQADAAAQSAYSSSACEADGTCGSGKLGAGALYAAKVERFDELKTMARTVRQRNQIRLDQIDVQIAELSAARANELRHFQNVTALANDLLARRAALASLEADKIKGGYVSSTGWIIRLLSLFIELLPLFVKISSPRGPYDAAYQAIQDGESAKWQAVGAKAAERSRTLIVQEAMLAETVRGASHAIILDAGDAALNCEAARKARDDLAAEIVQRAANVARAAAASVFDDRKIHDDVVATAMTRRREADAEIVETEAKAAAAFHDLDDAVRSASNLRSTEGPFH